jgi:hypothetical protein
MVSVVVVNVVTIAADLQAGAAGLGLLTGVEPGWLAVPLGLVPGSLLLAGKYHHVASAQPSSSARCWEVLTAPCLLGQCQL